MNDLWLAIVPELNNAGVWNQSCETLHSLKAKKKEKKNSKLISDATVKPCLNLV